MEQRKYESDMSLKEKINLEKSYLHNMTFLQKVEHIIAYYKTHMLLAVILLIGILFGAYFVYRFQVDIVFNALIVNSQGGDIGKVEIDFKEYIGDDNCFHDVFIDNTLFFSGASLPDRYKEMKLASYIENDLVDVMILDEEYYRKYKESKLLQPFFKVMSDEEIIRLQLEVEDEYGVNITQNSKLKEYGFMIKGDVYLVVLQDAPYPENAKRFIEFLYE